MPGVRESGDLADRVAFDILMRRRGGELGDWPGLHVDEYHERFRTARTPEQRRQAAIDLAAASMDAAELVTRACRLYEQRGGGDRRSGEDRRAIR